MSDETASAPPPARRSAGTGDRGGVVLVTLAVVALLLIVLPLVALLAQVRWGSLLDDLTTAGAREALWLSLRTTVTSALLAYFFGTPLAWWLDRKSVV